MKSVVLFLVIAGVMQGGDKPTAPSCDALCVQVVRHLLDESAARVSSGYGEKQSARLGDKIAPALRKIYRPNALKRSKNIRVFLPVIRAAFLYPELIANEDDRVPTDTLKLLQDLENSTRDPKTKAGISEVVAWLKERK